MKGLILFLISCSLFLLYPNDVVYYSCLLFWISIAFGCERGRLVVGGLFLSPGLVIHDGEMKLKR